MSENRSKPRAHQLSLLDWIRQHLKDDHQSEGVYNEPQAICFLDTETTGLDPSLAEVIEVAVIRCDPDGSQTRFHTLIKPQRIEHAHSQALELNGYAANPSRWDDAPTMAQVGDNIADVIKNSVICGHNVGFDEAMILANFERAGVRRRIPYHKVDTVTLAWEHLVPLGLEGLGMDCIREFLGWSKEGAHTAMKDAEDAKRLYHLLCRMTKEQGNSLHL
jgi:DNA polymerase-3 subunit epsilon